VVPGETRIAQLSRQRRAEDMADGAPKASFVGSFGDNCGEAET
jgi:hypothetical protein